MSLHALFHPQHATKLQAIILSDMFLLRHQKLQVVDATTNFKRLVALAAAVAVSMHVRGEPETLF
jgi:hypothetical protein